MNILEYNTLHMDICVGLFALACVCVSPLKVMLDVSPLWQGVCPGLFDVVSSQTF